MSNNNELLTDDYVADLLSQEASDCSLKYSTMGMEAYRTNKKPVNMMKPNTRFLRHIIKDTDNHNKALLAKEAAESKARLKDLERSEEIKRRKTNPNVNDIRRRQMGDIHAILGGKRRPRTEDEAGPSSSRRDSKRSDKDRKSEREQAQDVDDLFTDRRSDRGQHGRLSREDRRSKTDDDSRRSDRSRREHKRRDRSRSRDRGSDEEGRHRHSHRRRDRSRTPTRRRRSRSPRESKSRHRHRSPLDTKEDRKRNEEQEEDSDVLEDLIGPAPPPKYRGRGTVGGSSGIDRRFSETYDPKTDIQMDEDDDGNTWDDAVEVFRDRQKLRQNQEQRMKAAGFADEQIQRANGTDEKSAESVQWSKAGEKRAWDVGKVIGADGMLQSED